jgi:hypothetical protein
MRIELPTITDTALEALNQSAIKIQAELLDRTGEWYELPALNEALARWLEFSIEALCEDAVEHCVICDRSYAFNRHGFDSLLKKVPSVNVWQQQSEAEQERKDQDSIAIERVA